MRDPARIPKLLELIRQIWEDNPDMRLMQLLMPVLPKHDIGKFYLEDDDLGRALALFYSEVEKL